MNAEKFIAYAQEQGISEVQIFVNKSSQLSFSLYHHELEGYGISNSQNLVAMGIYQGKFGFSTTEKLDSSAFPFLVKGIKEAASLNEKENTLGFFKGSEKYHKKNVFSKALAEKPVEEKIALAKSIEEKLWNADPRITDVADVSYFEREESTELYNSFGLKLKQKSNYCILDGSVVAKNGKEVKTGGDLFLGNDLSKLDPDAFVKKIADDALLKLGGAPCESKKYPTLIRNSVFSSLLSYFLENLSAEEVERRSSLLEGKLHEKIASKKLTILEKPLEKNVFFSYFDDEGVAKENKVLVNKGVLETYLHNRETAQRAGVETTGNASLSGAKIGISFSNVFVKPGKKSLENVIKDVKEGVYITDVAGLGTGMNAKSGDFSCQAEGFMIRDGKIAEPLSLITLSGNLLKMLNDIRDFDSRIETQPNAITTPDVLIRSMNIGGK